MVRAITVFLLSNFFHVNEQNSRVLKIIIAFVLFKPDSVMVSIFK